MDYDAAALRIILYTVGFILFLVVGNVIGASSRKKKEAFRKFDDLNERYVLRTLNTQSLTKAKQYKEILEDAHKEAQIPDSLSWGYNDDMSLVRDAVENLEMEDWERRAVRHLDAFYDCYDALTNCSLESFKDVEMFFKTKKKCIREWQSYFAVDVSEYDVKIYPKQYMREYLGDGYDPCMESHEALEKKLDDYVQRMRPEQKRKNLLYKKIVQYVQEQETVAQAALLKVDFPGYIEAEVKCCYTELIKRDRLVKTKLGNRWFVSLSDKEISKQ